MRKIHVTALKPCNYKYGFNISIASHKGRIYKQLTPFTSCRSWICDVLFMIKNPTYKDARLTYEFVFPVKEKNTNILISGNKENIEYFHKNIQWLHDKEDKAKVKRSIVFTTQNSNALLIKGGAYWKNSCWKYMLYTFYLKCCMYENPETCDKLYWNHLLSLNKNKKVKEDVLLSRVKCRKELFDKTVYGENNNLGRHAYEGFVSICNGNNKPMAKYLGVE